MRVPAALSLLALLSACDDGSDPQIAALEAELAEVVAVNEEIRSRLSIAEDALAQQAEELAAITGTVDLTELSERVSALVDSLAADVEAIEAAGYVTESWVLAQGYGEAADIAALEADLAANIADTNNNTAALTAHDTLLSANAVAISSNTAAISTNQTNIAANTSSLSSLSSTVSSLSSTVSTLSGTVSGLSTTVTGLSSSVTSLSGDLSDLQSDVSALDGELSSLSGDVSDIESSVSTLDADLDAIDASVADLESETSCPSDMADAGGFCIDVDENTSQSWQAHANQCQSEGKRMCSLAEWIGACNDRSALGLSNMLDGDFEYVDEYWVMNYTNGNYYQSYVSVGNDSCGRIYYSGWGCTNSSCYDTTNVGGSYVSRCCL